MDKFLSGFSINKVSNYVIKAKPKGIRLILAHELKIMRLVGRAGRIDGGRLSQPPILMVFPCPPEIKQYPLRVTQDTG